MHKKRRESSFFDHFADSWSEFPRSTLYLRSMPVCALCQHRAVLLRIVFLPSVRLTSSRRPPLPVSNSSSSIWTRTNVSFGSRPSLMTLMNSIQAFSFVVSWSHSPAGPLGDVNKHSFICQKSPSVQRANALSSADRCYLIRHATQ